jgi:hypothetical protein
MTEFFTQYPKRINLLQGIQNLIKREEVELDQLFLMVQIKKDEIIHTLASEGFKMVKFENKKTSPDRLWFLKKVNQTMGNACKVIGF